MPYFTFSGYKLYYRIGGKGPLLLILPGNTASSRCHLDDLDYFSQYFTAASFDYLGTGMSERLDHFGGGWFHSCADQAAALIQHAGFKSAVLIGTSGGAVVALQTAARNPELVTAVVADSFSPIFTREMLERDVIEDRSVRSEEQIDFWCYAHGEDWEQVIIADTTMLTALVEEGGNWLDDALDKIHCPVLITASLEDQALIHPAVYALQAMDRLENSCCFISKKGKHPLMWSQSEVFRTVARSFLLEYDLLDH